MLKHFGFAIILAATTTIATAAEITPASPAVARLHADPIAGFQGEWASRFCDKEHRWMVEGRDVKMYKRDPKKPPTDYDNRHAEGSVIYTIREEYDRSDRGVRMKAGFTDPVSGRVSEGQFLAMTLYWNDPANKKGEYFGFNDMIRPAEHARQCK
jgi:hypothetical protein